MSDISSFSPLWGEWYVKELIGKGTFGAVYRAEKTEYGNTYTSAVKHISIPNDSVNAESLISEGVVSDESSVVRYYDAVRDKMISEINFCYALRGNTNIVSYEDHCIIPKADGAGYDIFIRMEHLTALPKYMRENSFTEKDIVKLGIDICSALEVLDKHNIIHRDIKPANIFVNSVGVYKLGDFGESKVLSNTNVGMTVRGTYTYMSPEISMGKSANITADIYSLGIVMYRLLNGNKAPFVPTNMPTVDAQTVENANIRRFRGDKLPAPMYCKNPQLAAVIMKACEYSPADRWQKPRDMRKTLEALLEGNIQSVAQAVSNADPSVQTMSAGSASSMQTMTVPGSSTPAVAQQSPEAAHNHNKKSKLRIIIPVFIALIAAACVVTILVLQKPPASQTSASETSSGAQEQSGNVSSPFTESSAEPVSSYVSAAESSAEPVSSYVSAAESSTEPVSSSVSTDESSAEPSAEPSKVELVSLKVVSAPTKTTYYLNESLDTAGIRIEAGYSDGTKKDIPAAECTFSGFSSDTPGEKKVTVRYGGMSDVFSLLVEQQDTSVIKGKCGADVRYVLDKDSGTLTISGKGAMDDQSLKYVILENGTPGVKCSAPWFDFSGLVKSVRIEDGVTRIGSFSFYDCSKLEKVYISDSVKILGESSFRGCSSLTGFNIPAGLEDIEDEVFINCKNISSFNVDVKNKSFSSQDGILYSKSKLDLIKCPEAKSGDISIPYGVWSIENWAFDGCTGITSIELPTSLTSIGGYAFSGCTGISRIVIGKNVTMMGGSVFRYWQSSQRIEIPEFSTVPVLWAKDWDSECDAQVLFSGGYG